MKRYWAHLIILEAAMLPCRRLRVWQHSTSDRGLIRQPVTTHGALGLKTLEFQ